jgi:hypothetical protein
MGAVAAVVPEIAPHGAGSTGLYILAVMAVLAVCWAIVFVMNK